MINPVKSFLTHGPLLTLGVVIFSFGQEVGRGGMSLYPYNLGLACATF